MIVISVYDAERCVPLDDLSEKWYNMTGRGRGRIADIAGVSREYRDRVFKFIFGDPDNKEWTLSLYNAVNGSSYTDPDDIKITTIENAVYLSMKTLSELVNKGLLSLTDAAAAAKMSVEEFERKAAAYPAV